MPRTFTCLHCGKLTTRNPRLKKKQKYCSSRKCQNARKRAFDKKVDPTLKCRMLRKQRNKRWRDNKPAHEYQHSYRNLHPDYVSIKRKQQKKRNILHNKGSSSIIVKTDALFLQSIDYFGPVVIPMKGMQIELDSFKFEKYGFIISEYENGKAAIKNEYFRALSESSYSFSKNYYFFMGDNRHNSIDSRYIGVITLFVAAISLLKAFAFDIYYIPSPSMEATLRKGDVVLMKKFPSRVFKKSLANALNKDEGNTESPDYKSERLKSSIKEQNNI